MTTYTAFRRTIYFVRPVSKLEPIKIGCTDAVERRLREIRPVVRSELELLATVRGSMDDERRIHSLFWHDRIEGEWFSWSRGLQILIDAAARGELDIEALPPARIRRKPEISAANARRRAAQHRALSIDIFPGNPGDVPQSRIEAGGDNLGLVQRDEEIVRRQDELHFEPADAVTDVEHAFPQGNVGRFLTVENGVEIMPVHYAPVTDKGVKTVTGATR